MFLCVFIASLASPGANLIEDLGEDGSGLERFLQHSPAAPSDDLVQFATATGHETFCQEQVPGVGTAKKEILWRLAETLQRCGVRALPNEWLSEDLQWQQLQQEVSDSFGALADVRSDDASIICRRFRAAKSAANESDGPRFFRCPRCGKAIGQAKDMQSRLQVFHHDLNRTSDSTAGTADGENGTLIEISAACREELHVHAARFQQAQSSPAMLAEIESLECNSCELQALGAVDSVDLLWSALGLLHCAPQLDEAPSLLEPRLHRAMDILEFNLWKGIGFPSLHEAVSKEIFDLRLSKRFQNFELSRLCIALNKSVSVVVSGVSGLGPTHFWEEEERQMLAENHQPADLSIGYFRLAHRLKKNAMDAAQQAVPQSLALAGFWLRQVENGQSPVATQAAQLVAEAAYRAATRLPPGLQMLVLQTCLEALRPFNGRPLQMHHQVLQHLRQIQGQMPVTLPSHVSLVQLRQIEPYVERLHSSFARLLQTVSLQELADARDSPIFLFAAAAASSKDAARVFFSGGSSGGDANPWVAT